MVALPDRLPADPSGPGHLIKARYTPLQVTVLGADEPDSPHYEVLRAADDLGGVPVVIADLHSALPARLAGLRASRPVPAAYVMLDGGALPRVFLLGGSTCLRRGKKRAAVPTRCGIETIATASLVPY